MTLTLTLTLSLLSRSDSELLARSNRQAAVSIMGPLGTGPLIRCATFRTPVCLFDDAITYLGK
jgi:hypothetical protein